MSGMSRTIIFCVLIFVLLSCKLIDTVTGGGPDMIRSDEMWSDVPKMDSFTKSDLELPVTVKLLMRTALNNLWRLNSNGEDKTPVQGDWIVFATNKTLADVQAFYTADRMKSAGNWQGREGTTCMDGKDKGTGGVFCTYEKRTADKQTELMIVAMNDEEKKVMNVFFLRLEGDAASLNSNKASSK